MQLNFYEIKTVNTILLEVIKNDIIAINLVPFFEFLIVPSREIKIKKQ